ncbi:hypothetical protein Tco_1028386 [Tanacetum coccineum]|uniref:Uncharacterized protein n=1 Tax=Tanacetum coccineum TaxID=301880 RepID=A0ABQ5G0R7_9ASTR
MSPEMLRREEYLTEIARVNQPIHYKSKIKSQGPHFVVVVVVLLWWCCGGAIVVLCCCGGAVVVVWCCGGGGVVLLLWFSSYDVVLRWLLFGSGVVVVNMENYEDKPVTLTCRSKLKLIKLIRTKFRKTPREELFRNTCFGWLLDLVDSQENCVLIHFMTCRREEFCLITGLRFGPKFSERYEVGLFPFRRLLFDSDTDGEEFDNLHDEDVVSVCQLAVLHLVLLGRQLAHNIPDWWLRLIDDKKLGNLSLGRGYWRRVM